MTNPHPLFQPTLTAAGLNTFGLSITTAPPHKALNGIVHSYLQITARHATPYPVIPDGTQAIFISSQGSMISGALSQAQDVLIPEAGEYFGVRFCPGGLRRIFKLDVSEITDQFVDQNQFTCPEFASLHDALYSQPNFSARTAICECWLLNRLNTQSPSRLEHSLSLIHQSGGNIRISALAQQVGTSTRHLNRLFRLNTGLSTKAFTQTVRLQQVCQQLLLPPSRSLAAMALDFGFADQPHLTNEFQKHLQLSPCSFINRFMSDFYNR